MRGERGVTGRFWSRRRWISAAAGVSVAYVFVDVLPELAEQNKVITAAAGSAVMFAEQRIYMLALLSFVILYGLQHMVLGSREARRNAVEEGRGRDRVYWLHLAGFALYSALIGYLLVERADRGVAALVVYTLAMAIHFLIVNHTLSKEHGSAYRSGWPLVACGERDRRMGCGGDDAALAHCVREALCAAGRRRGDHQHRCRAARMTGRGDSGRSASVPSPSRCCC